MVVKVNKYPAAELSRSNSFWPDDDVEPFTELDHQTATIDFMLFELIRPVRNHSHNDRLHSNSIKMGIHWPKYVFRKRHGFSESVQIMLLDKFTRYYFHREKINDIWTIRAKRASRLCHTYILISFCTIGITHLIIQIQKEINVHSMEMLLFVYLCV